MLQHFNSLFFRKLLVCFIALVCSFQTKAQDPHFTQYYAAPLLLNPALTGFFNGDVRTSGCYRNQWPSVQYPYITGTFSADANVMKSYVKDGDVMGIGFTGLFDKSNNGGLKASTLSTSFSYHKLLDQRGINRLGIGFMASYNTKNLDYSKFTFGQQLTPLGFDNTLPTGESKNGFSTNYVDYAVGLLYSAITDYSSFYVGSSMYHINQPTESFNGPVHTIQPRFVVHSGGYFNVGDINRVSVSGAYMKTEISNDLIFGAAYSLGLSQVVEDNYNLILGGWFRYNDAFAPYIGMDYGNFRGGISYDINVSKLQTASNLKGGFELTLTYLFTQSPEANAIRQTLCPGGFGRRIRWYNF
jgi:type IX secretion system PorP/SprF family membrane protein